MILQCLEIVSCFRLKPLAFACQAVGRDVLQIDILEAKPKQDWGFSAILPNLGTLPDEFTNYQRSHTKIDRVTGTGQCAWPQEFKHNATARTAYATASAGRALAAAR